MDVSTVTGFSSQPSAAVPQAATIRDVVDALGLDTPLAQSLFTRVCKRALVLALESSRVSTVRRLASGFPLSAPVILVTSTVYLNPDQVDHASIEACLLDIIEGLTNEVIRMARRCEPTAGKLVLQDALGAQIAEVSKFGDLKFQLKQKVSYGQ